MIRIFRLPLIPILISYTIGLYVGQFDLPFPSQGLLLLLPLLALWTLLILLKRIQWGSWMAFSFFLFLGITSIQHYLLPGQAPSPITRFIGYERILVEGTVDRTPHRTPGRTQLLIKPRKVILSDHHVPVEGRFLLFMKEENRAFRLGDRLWFLCKLFRPHGFHNPGVFSYERYLAFEGIHAIGFLSDEKMWVKVGEGYKNPLLLRIEAWRDHIRDFLEKEGTPPFSSIFQALVLGEQGNIPEEVKELFITTGIAHLLAISGDHLGIVAFLSFFLLTWFFKRSEFLLLSISIRKWAAGLTIPCILLYTFIAGGGISVIRATIMVVTFFFSIVFDRERHLLHTLALAAFIILLFSPPSLFDVSFQLSFLAVLSILYLVPRLLREWRREEIPIHPEVLWKQKVWKYMKLSLVATGVAMLGTAPLVALHFNRVSLIGLLTNLFAIPWVGFIIVPLSLIASIFSFFFYPLATLLITVNGYLTVTLLQVVTLFASIPYASISVATPTAIEMILYYLLLFLIVYLRKGRKVRLLFAGVCILLAANLAYWNLKDLFCKDLTLTFIDVGHGDCILIEFPKGKRMLIDGGGLHEDRFDIGKNVIAPFLWKKKIRRIDTLVLTHPDPDHLKGLNFIASQFSINQFWHNGFKVDSEPYLQMENTLQRKKVNSYALDESTGPMKINEVEISILNPPALPGRPAGRRNPTILNNQSLVMRLQFNEIVALLTGDIEKETEERIVRKGHQLRAHILKVPHHGSSTSSSATFLDRVKPLYAILSVGERNIGRLPRPEVIKRYEGLGAKIFRTDQHGAITVKTDGRKVEIKTFLKGND